MAMKVRALAISMLMISAMWLVGCGHYVCTKGFGATTCGTGGNGGFSQGSGGTSSTAAFAFAVDEAGTIDGYTLTTGGTTPSFAATASYTAPTVPTNSEGSGMVVAQKKYLYTAFPGTGQIYAYTISSGGGLTAIANSPFSAPFLVGEPTGGEWSMITNPAGTFLFMVDTSGMSVHVYQIGSAGALTQVTGSPFAVPFFPGNLGTDGEGKYLYVAQSPNPSEVAAYVISSTGSLTLVPGSPFSYAVSQVQGDSSGKYLIGVSNTFGTNGIYVFSIAQSGGTAGAITPVVGSPFATAFAPISFAVQPNSGGTLIYTFSENAAQTAYNPIEGFQLDPTSGALTVATGSPYSGVTSGFWGQFDQSGANLVVYGGVNDGTTITTYLGALSVGSDGTLTQPTSQLTLAGPGFWTVTDPQ
jgi:6-phosphogluconolactonase